MIEIGRGHEGIVYEDRGVAIKQFYSDRKLTEDTTTIGIRLSKINFSSFAKPYNFVLDKNGIIQKYYMDLLPKGKNGKFTLMDIDDLVSSLRNIRNDINKMTDSKILLCDFFLHNIKVVNNKIYFYDFSDYRLGDDDPLLRTHNDNEMNSLFGSIGVMDENLDINPIDVYDGLFAPFLGSGVPYIEDYIENNVRSKNLRSYIKKR
jgi:hypothetical protein